MLARKQTHGLLELELPTAVRVRLDQQHLGTTLLVLLRLIHLHQITPTTAVDAEAAGADAAKRAAVEVEAPTAAMVPLFRLAGLFLRKVVPSVGVDLRSRRG